MTKIKFDSKKTILSRIKAQKLVFLTLANIYAFALLRCSTVSSSEMLMKCPLNYSICQLVAPKLRLLIL